MENKSENTFQNHKNEDDCNLFNQTVIPSQGNMFLNDSFGSDPNLMSAQKNKTPKTKIKVHKKEKSNA